METGKWEIDEKSKQAILNEAKRLEHNLDGLIYLCEHILSEDKGRKNVQIRWNEREKKRRKMQRRKFMNAVFKLLRMKRRYEIDHTVFYGWHE